MHEEILIARCQTGDSSAFEYLVLRYQDKIFNLCRYLLKNPHDAEDAAQEAFLKAFNTISRYTPDAPFYTWLSSIAVNTCLDCQRKARLRSLFFFNTDQARLDAYPSNRPNPEASYANHQSMQELQSGLQQLSIKLRTVIVLKELEGFSYEEIANTLDISIGTVKSRLSRGREELVIIMKKITEQNRF